MLEIQTNRFRSLLSLIGVALSIGATTAMVCFLRGADIYLRNLVQEMGGSGTVQVVTKPAAPGMEKAIFGRSGGLRISDADSLLRSRPWGATPYKVVERFLPVLFKSTKELLIVRGVDREALETGEKVLVDQGRFFSPGEYSSGARVCVIGWKLAEEARKILKEDRAPLVGETIRIDGQAYAIVGIFTKNYRKWERPGFILYMPLSSLQKDFAGSNPAVPQMTVRLTALDSEPGLTDSLATYFKRIHRGAEDISFASLDGTRDIRAMMRNLQLTFWAIILVSMGIGCTNIFNLMLSTLSERIVEIGIRKSIGATKWEVFSQFLVESLSLCLIGGSIGTAIGLAPLSFADAIEAATGGIRPWADSHAFLLVFLLVLAMGLFSGLYPAAKAARLDPVEALRHS